MDKKLANLVKFRPKFEPKSMRRRIFFFRRGGNEPSEGAYTKYVTELRRNF
ncbi:hypothetical protein [Campylobacter rectus]|uniref:hypothetical protein n=1 Tax=Campylobacter rectus TaxID=203 RepID=UPI0028EB11DB|nr:hypothetical protein [Campylobacter rectus]